MIDVKVSLGFLAGVLAMWIYMKWCERRQMG